MDENETNEAVKKLRAIWAEIQDLNRKLAYASFSEGETGETVVLRKKQLLDEYFDLVGKL